MLCEDDTRMDSNPNALRTANDYVQFALTLMQSTPPQYLAASCIFRFLHQNISESEKPKLAKFLVQCGIALHDASLMNYVSQIPMNDMTQQAQLARFMLNTTLHEQKRDECVAEAERQPDFRSASCTWDDVILVCAGGDKLLHQLHCNLKSLEIFQYSHTLQDIPIVVAHADEIKEAEMAKFRSTFSKLKLEFFNVAESALVLESRLTASSLRGFQIKLAALVAIPACRVLMMDADLLWVKDPRHIITKCKCSGVHAHLFCDFWHFVERRHEKSSSTSFLYSLYGIDYNISEFESGVVFFDREHAYKSIAMLRYMVMNYEYYFSLTFGDKDLFYLALKYQKASVSISEIPKMLGCVYNEGREGRDTNMFYSQSMIQSFDGSASHIHTTLHPVGDEGFDIPTHICEDGRNIQFVQRRINNKVVGTVACDMMHAVELQIPNVFNHIYVCALKDENTYLKE